MNWGVLGVATLACWTATVGHSEGVGARLLQILVALLVVEVSEHLFEIHLLFDRQRVVLLEDGPGLASRRILVC